MTSLKTFAVFAVLAVGVGTAAKAQRQFGLENDERAWRAIDTGVRASAVEYNPKVDLTAPVLQDFELLGVQITRPRIMVLLGVGDDYEVYAHFREGGSDRCMTLSLSRVQGTDAWNAVHSGVVDRCAPLW
jgi:hypothetical protein